MSSKRRRSRDESERAQRERLAEARRERERKARANLAAKARGEEGESAEPEAKSGAKRAEGSEPGKPAHAEKKPEAGSKPKPGPKRDKEAGEKASERKRAGEEAKRPAFRSRKDKPARRRGARKPDRGGKRGSRRRGGAIAAAKGGAAAVRSRVTTVAPRAGAVVLRALVAFFTVFFAALGALIRGGAAVVRFVRGPLVAALQRLDALIRAASRQVAPARVLTVVAAGALLLLALSQFADYRSISIGNDSYAPGIQTVAPAPVTETDPTGSAHGYLMVPLAAVGLLLLGLALTGRRRLLGPVAVIGLVAILVALVHDRPAGLDTGDRPLAYEGVEATLVGGFYAQIAAGLLLAASSLLLARELRPAEAGTSARSRRRLPALRRPRLRRRARVEGARA